MKTEKDCIKFHTHGDGKECAFLVAKHTPTPWIQRGENVVADLLPCGTGVNEVSILSAERPFGVRVANADFIVRAVNAHDELVRIAKMLLFLDINLPKNWNRDEDGAYTTEESETDRLNEIRRQVHAVLAKAEGVQSMENAYSEGGEFRSHNRD